LGSIHLGPKSENGLKSRQFGQQMRMTPPRTFTPSGEEMTIRFEV
jgi:hypothetical protein